MTNLIWSGDKNRIVGLEATGAVYVWDLTSNIVDIIRLEDTPIRDGALSPVGGQLALTLLQRGAMPENISGNEEGSLLSNAVQILVPIATAERFAEIAAFCNAPVSLTAIAEDAWLMTQSEVAQGRALLAQLDALADDAIPPGCEADLRAIAGAMGDK